MISTSHPSGHHSVTPARRRALGVLAAAAAAAALVWVPTGGEMAHAASGKITICHRTHATTNPYRRITVSQNAVQNARHGGHGLPNGSSNPAVYDSTFSYAPNNKYWGDIIPGGDADGLPYNGANPIAKNWTAAGKADFTAYCAPLTPTQFYNAEVAAGQLPADVIADLNEQAANEDVALLAAIGGSFTTANMSTWTTAVTVTTTAATSVTATSATLNGTLSVGSTTTLTSFQYGTDPALTASATVTATPSSVTNTASVSAAISGLTGGTTYYFRVLGTTNAGTDTEGILLGDILSFVTGAPPTSSTTTTTTPATTAPATTEPTTTAPTTTTDPTTTAATTTEPATTEPTTSEPATTAPATTEPATTTPTTTTPPTTTPATTAPATTEPATTSPTPAGEATVRGVVWFDRNHDGVLGASEWVLPGVTVTLSGSSTPAGFGAGERTRRTTAAAAVRTAMTASDGTYVFSALSPGLYTVTAGVTMNGFDYTFDTDGTPDWIVHVTAPVGGTANVDFAGLGRGEVVGQVFETTSLTGLPFATITCRWNGYDDTAGTADDMVFTATGDQSGTFDLSGVPYGYFTCDGFDATTGRTSASANATVFSPLAVQAPLPVTVASAVVPTEGATPSSVLAVPSGELPTTGRDTRSVLQLAVLLTAGGVGVIIAVRRRAPRFTKG